MRVDIMRLPLRLFGTGFRAVRTVVLVLGLVLVLNGCGAGRFGSELEERPKPQPVRRAEGVTLHIPAEQQFSIALPQSSRQAGLGGTAQSDATVTPAGNADAWAEVSSGGQASGLFQLGHSFSNETGQVADFEFVVRLGYAYSASATPETAFADAKVGLKLYARTNMGRLVRDITLFTHETSNGPAQGTASASSQFTLTLLPNEAVNVFIAGQAAVDIREQRSGAGRVSVSNLAMDVTIRPSASAPRFTPGFVPQTGAGAGQP